MNKKLLALLLLILPIASFAKGINVTKDQFEKNFCDYLSNPDIKTETAICPIYIRADEEANSPGSYRFEIQNGSYVTLDVDSATNKIVDVGFYHSQDIAHSDDVMQTRYAIINAVDKQFYKNHGEDFYHLISANKAYRAGMKKPEEHNSLSHNGIDYTYMYSILLNDGYLFRAQNH